MDVNTSPNSPNQEDARSGFTGRDQLLRALSSPGELSPDQRTFDRLTVESNKARIGANPEQGAYVTS